ncbi:hypothetical protein B9479_002985 [Cryptococcus floricola]|uniref:Uncharacterized protein n=1 Tax=Cryptococcus floricola TaxID=2591691 RepID=A0A5D3AY94_9TREE|nr:hypothetical protein B9479_002985 [Cryptococcus floricola]
MMDPTPSRGASQTSTKLDAGALIRKAMISDLAQAIETITAEGEEMDRLRAENEQLRNELSKRPAPAVSLSVPDIHITITEEGEEMDRLRAENEQLRNELSKRPAPAVSLSVPDIHITITEEGEEMDRLRAENEQLRNELSKRPAPAVSLSVELSHLVTQILSDADFRDRLAYGPLALVPPGKRQGVVKAAILCCVEGPRGVGKIDALRGLGISNREWFSLCGRVAVSLKEVGDFDGSTMMTRFGKLWPLCDAELQAAHRAA